MSTKLKALGLGLVAAMAIGAFGVMNAGATTGGHFTSESTTDEHTTLIGTESGEHTTGFFAVSEVPIVCQTADYTGTTDENTVEEVTIEPDYDGCSTEGETPGSVHVDMNSCDYVFTVRGDEPDTKHNTVHIDCEDPDDKIDLVHTDANCTIEIGEQTVGGGVLYTNEGSPHEVTVDITAEEIEYTLHNFPCNLLGTTHNDGELFGSVTLEGRDKLNSQVNITATGTE